MAAEFRLTVQDTPGTLARLGTILGEAGVNIEAIQGTSREEKGFVQFVPSDEEKTAVALDAGVSGTGNGCDDARAQIDSANAASLGVADIQHAGAVEDRGECGFLQRHLSSRRCDAAQARQHDSGIAR